MTDSIDVTCNECGESWKTVEMEPGEYDESRVTDGEIEIGFCPDCMQELGETAEGQMKLIGEAMKDSYSSILTLYRR